MFEQPSYRAKYRHSQVQQIVRGEFGVLFLGEQLSGSPAYSRPEPMSYFALYHQGKTEVDYKKTVNNAPSSLAAAQIVGQLPLDSRFKLSMSAAEEQAAFTQLLKRANKLVQDIGPDLPLAVICFTKDEEQALQLFIYHPFNVDSNSMLWLIQKAIVRFYS